MFGKILYIYSRVCVAATVTVELNNWGCDIVFKDQFLLMS